MTTATGTLFSVTVWSHRLKRTLTVFNSACTGECEDLCRELIDEFCRELKL